MKIKALRSSLNVGKMNIGKRLTLLTGTMVITFLVVASLAFFSLTFSRQSASELHQEVREVTRLTIILSSIQQGLVGTLNDLNTGVITWETAEQTLVGSQQTFSRVWREMLSEHQKIAQLGGTEQAIALEIFAQMERSLPGVSAAYDEVESLKASRSKGDLELFLLNDLEALVGPFTQAASAYANKLSEIAEKTFVESEAMLTNTFFSGTAIILVSLVVAILLAQAVRRSITKPVLVISDTVKQVEKGEMNARTGLSGTDELSQLGEALDHLLTEKVTSLVKAEKENEVLNNSVIELLEGTSQLSGRDLTTKIQVREDITGPVADSLNLVTKEISQALGKISHVSHLVEATSVMVEEQNKAVVNVADTDREIVLETTERLENLAQHMGQIAKWCQSCNEIAQSTAGSTDKAYEAVGSTVDSMDEIRESISETEKKIKRLSERSQEISTIIDLINSIAERTHVLALNASMQAAAAGEAGRGFAVVADEVQRLAESSRNATSQISALVRNIQVETADAVDKMNDNISLVVNGSKRATNAGSQMEETINTAREMLQAVEKIAQSSLEQAKEAQGVQTGASRLQDSVRTTNQELKRQSMYTERLRTASSVLQQTVHLFELPETATLNVQIPELKQEADSSESSEKAPFIPTAKLDQAELKQAS